MKKWIHKIKLHAITLEKELNSLSSQRYTIYKVWYVRYDEYEILAYREE